MPRLPLAPGGFLCSLDAACAGQTRLRSMNRAGQPVVPGQPFVLSQPNLYLSSKSCLPVLYILESAAKGQMPSRAVVQIKHRSLPRPTHATTYGDTAGDGLHPTLCPEHSAACPGWRPIVRHLTRAWTGKTALFSRSLASHAIPRTFYARQTQGQDQLPRAILARAAQPPPNPRPTGPAASYRIRKADVRRASRSAEVKRWRQSWHNRTPCS